MKKDVYIYPAIFTYAEDGISIEFPDLQGCLPCANTTEEAIKNSKEAMALHLHTMEENSEDIPEPTQINKIKLVDNQAIMVVEVYMPMFRPAIEDNSVKKTLTIPMWLNKIGEAKEVNFSRILKEALIEHLGLRR